MNSRTSITAELYSIIKCAPPPLSGNGGGGGGIETPTKFSK